MDYFLVFILFGSFLFAAVAIFNFFTAPKVKKTNSLHPSTNSVSILIPARNEESNIGNLLESLTKQDHQAAEILILDDNSMDRTASIVKNYIAKLPQLSLINGSEIPVGWLGKNWACHQLSQKAKGDYLLFLDADVTLADEAISSLVSIMSYYKLDMLTVFPTQKINSFGEWLVVPLMNWILLSLLPLRKVFTSKNKSYIAADGQTILIKKSIYNNIGGHAAVKNNVVEDMGIARKLKSNQYKMMTLLGDNQIFCSMYKSFNEAITGYSKNFYPGFQLPAVVFISMILVFFAIGVSPFIGIVYNELYYFAIIFIISNRILVSILSKQNVIYNLILHPLQFVIMVYVGVYSAVQAKRKKLNWKGRKISV
jgi:chlorobactene glucosyltransferase